MTIREEKEMQGIHSGKEEEKMSLFADDVILYIENLKCASRKLLELIDEFGKVARYKINTQKSFALLYTNSKRSEGEIKETIPFTITSKRIKYLGINLPKETKSRDITLPTKVHLVKSMVFPLVLYGYQKRLSD